MVVVSSVWQTTAVLVRGPGVEPEGLLIDSPLLPVELESLEKLAGDAGFPVSALLATHGDWDHLLGRLAFPDASLGVDQRTAARLEAHLGAPQRLLRDFDEEWYVERPAPLTLGEIQPLPVPGHLELGEVEFVVHDGAGHTADGLVLWLPWAKVLICGDYLSPLELPAWDHGGSRELYRDRLERLAPLVEQSERVIVGHGGALDPADAARILDEDRAYLETAEPPRRGRRGQHAADHARNLAAWDGPGKPRDPGHHDVPPAS